MPGLACALVLLAVTTACTASKVDDDAAIRVTGVVQAASGSPTPDVDVSLLKVADLGEIVLGGVLAFGTFGAVCLAEEAPAICDGAHHATTSADGGFSLDLEGDDTQGTAGQASDLDLSASVDGLLATVRFKVQREELAVPALRMWDHTPGLSTSGDELVPRWDPLPDGYGSDPTYALSFEDGDGALVWAEQDASTGSPVDLRLLEDRQGSLRVVAKSEQDGPDTTFRFTHFSRPVPFAGAGPASSRGLTCAASTEDGRVTPLDPCPLTDGDLSERAGFGGAGLVHSIATVDLGVPHVVDLVVARGAIGGVTVETSLDGTSWTFAGSSTGSLVGVVPPGGEAEARYVRVRSNGGADLSSLAEISVWTR